MQKLIKDPAMLVVLCCSILLLLIMPLALIVPIFAWRSIQTITAAPAKSAVPFNFPVADFVDHPEKYKGMELTLILNMGNLHGSLRDYVGGSMPFYGFTKDIARFAMMIDLPRGLDVPNVSAGTRLRVTFRCEWGMLDVGNVAVKIDRE